MEKITLRIFWTAMLCCASLVIIGIWFEEQVPEAVFKAAGTLFVIGLANFLIWVPLVVGRSLAQASKP